MQLHAVLTIFLLTDTSGIWASLSMNDVISMEAEERETTLSPEDFMAAESLSDESLSHLGIETMQDPSSPNKLEGDMAINNIHQFIDDSNQRARNAIKSRWRRWPNGQIPYVLSSRYGSYSRKTIARAMNAYHKHTCVRFVPRDSKKHRDYIYIHPDDGCYSLVGRTGGRQPLSLDVGCIQTGTVIHELMHTVGFFHEQSRNDRDQWIKIDWSNVLRGASDQFDKYSLRTISHLDEEYDYDSIMHYGPYAFSRNGRKTILPRKSGGRKMGQREGFSRTDLRKINKLYHCDVDVDTEDEEERVVEKERKTKTIVTKPDTKTTTSKDCKDNNWRCFFWSLGVVDYCEKYEKVRTEICPKSCGTCTKTDAREKKEVKEKKPEPTTTAPAPTTTTAASTSTAPATTTTAEAGKKPEGKKCQDQNPNCPKWADGGLCGKSGYSRFMSNYCRKSCNKCATKPESNKKAERAKKTKTECRDSPGYKLQCYLVKQLGGCRSTRNKRLTETHCRKSCRLC